MTKVPGSPDDSNAHASEPNSTVPDELHKLDQPFEPVESKRNPALGLSDAAAANANGRRPPVSWAPPPSMSVPDDPWDDDESRADRAALGLLSRPSWDQFQPDEDRFTFPPPVADGSSVAPVAMAPEEESQVAPRTGLRWSTLVIALAATLGMSAMVLAVYGAATRGGSAMWGWNWKAAPQPTAGAFAAQEPRPDFPREALPGGLPTTPREYVRDDANSELDRVANRARLACAEPGTTPTPVRIVATFGPDGRVQDAQVEPQRGGHTRTTRCVDEIVRAATVAPFEGDSLTVSKTVDIP